MPLRGIQMCGMPPVNATVQILWAFENVWQNGRGHFKLGREVPIDPHDKKWAKWAWRGNIPPRFLCCGLQCGGEVWRSSGRILQTNKTVSNKWHFSKIGYFECNIFFFFCSLRPLLSFFPRLVIRFHLHMTDEHILRVNITHWETGKTLAFYPSKKCSALHIDEEETLGFFGRKGFSGLDIRLSFLATEERPSSPDDDSMSWLGRKLRDALLKDLAHLNKKKPKSILKKQK